MTQPHYIDREAVARIIDPAAFMFSPGELADKVYSASRAHAFDRADRILALIAAPMEAVAWRYPVLTARDEAVARMARAMWNGKAWPAVFQANTAEALAKDALTALEALAVIPTEGLGSSATPIPTEWSERPEVVLQYAQQVATYAAKRVGCVDEWRPLEDVYGCLTQIDNCLTGLVAKQGGESQ